MRVQQSYSLHSVVRLRIAAKPANPRRPARAIIASVGSVGTAGGPLPALQEANEIVLVSSVTAPFLASALPMMFAPVFNVMLVSAIRFPTNDVVVPRVAELPICQPTPHGFPPLIRETDAADELKTTDFGVAVGAGVTVSRLLLEGRYTTGLTDFNKGGTGHKNRVISLLVGLHF